jgi:hypothetical protein
MQSLKVAGRAAKCWQRIVEYREKNHWVSPEVSTTRASVEPTRSQLKVLYDRVNRHQARTGKGREYSEEETSEIGKVEYQEKY